MVTGYSSDSTVATHPIKFLRELVVFSYCIVTAAHFATGNAQVPARHHSVSMSVVVTPTKEDMAVQRLHDDDDSDVTQSCPPLSPPNQPLPGTDDPAAAMV